MSVELSTNLKTPISGRSFCVSPFNMKDYKWMSLVEQQSKIEDCVDTMTSVISQYSTLDPNTLSLAEFQWVFIQICRISCGSIIELNVKCPSCSNDIPFKITLDDFEIDKTKTMDDTLHIGESAHIKLKSISLNDLMKTKNDITDIRYIIDVLVSDGTEFDLSDISTEEMVEFIESLVTSDVDYMVSWLNNNNKYHLTKQWVCPHCFEKNTIAISGIIDVFKLSTFHINLMSYYKTSFRLAKDFGLSITEIEQMKPFEYKIYLNEVLGYIKEEESRLKNK